MKNPMKKAYEGVDSTLMYGANKAVQAWNWTTGRTKSDLANLLMDGFAITGSAGQIVLGPQAVVGVPVFLGIAHISQKENIKIDKLEQESAEEGMRHLKVERSKELHKEVGPLKGIMGIALLFPIQSYNIKIKGGSALCASAFAFWGASDYIMRTDYLPPRKNVLRRAKDKLKEMVEAYQQPGLLPMPAC